jgi:hypothetical protein
MDRHSDVPCHTSTPGEAIVLSAMEVEKAMRPPRRAGQPTRHRTGAPFIAAPVHRRVGFQNQFRMKRLDSALLQVP